MPQGTEDVGPLSLVSSFLLSFSTYQWIFVIGVFIFCATLAYKDIREIFEVKKISQAKILGHWPTMLLILSNSLLAAVIVLWSYYSPQAPINAIFPTGIQSDFWKAAFIGVGLPMALRSRITELGKEKQQILVGLEGLYKWIKDNVLVDLNRYSGRIKHKTARDEAVKLNNRETLEDIPNLLDDLKNYVVDDLRFRQIDKESYLEQYDNIREQMDVSGRRVDERYIQSQIQIAFDFMGVKPVRLYLRQIRN